MENISFSHLILFPISLCLPQIRYDCKKTKANEKEILISIEFKDNRILLIDNKEKRIVAQLKAKNEYIIRNANSSISDVNDNIDVNPQIVIKNGFMNENNKKTEDKKIKKNASQYEWGKVINQSATYNSIDPSEHTE